MGLGGLSRAAGRGQKMPITDYQVLTEVCQWWDAMQEIALQVNRPHGWGFQKITGGEIRYMKLWQVSVGVVRLGLRGY